MIRVLFYILYLIFFRLIFTCSVFSINCDNIYYHYSIISNSSDDQATVIKKWDLSKNGTTCVTKTTTHTSKKLRKWPNRDRTTPSSMALFGHYLAKNHPTKNAIEQKYSPRARASSGHAPWRCPTDFPFHGFPPALLTIFYIMNRQQGSRSG